MILPIVGMILAFIMMLELIQPVMETNFVKAAALGNESPHNTIPVFTGSRERTGLAMNLYQQ